MRELRKIQKAITQYERLLAYDQQEAKEKCDFYMNDIEGINSYIESYLDTTVDVFQKWCDANVSIFEMEERNVFQKVRSKIDMMIVNHYLNKLSFRMSKAGVLQKRLAEIKLRFLQYKCLI